MRNQEAVSQRLVQASEEYLEAYTSLLDRQPFKEASWSGGILDHPKRLVLLYAANRAMTIQTYASISASVQTLSGRPKQIIQNESIYTLYKYGHEYWTCLESVSSIGERCLARPDQTAKTIDFTVSRAILKNILDSPIPVTLMGSR